jgi:tetratricopeptide (TPR) repeat protein
MGEEIKNLEQGAKKAWPVVMGWVGGITALIGLFATLGGGVTWLVNHHKAKTERQVKLALAETQASQQDYQAAVQTYGDLLKADPLDRPVLDLQLNTAMQWAENFHVTVREDQHAEDLAGPALDQIFAILEAGLTRTKGSQAADVQAHLGWAHWLNQHIAEREFGPAAEQNLRAALAADPSNVYANAMLGNWMLQNGGNFSEAIHHFDVAVSTGKARPLVRKMQIGGLLHLDEPGARAAQIKAANDMRKAGEPLDEAYKSRILSFCLDPLVTDHKELTESLSAVPPNEAWQTYLWLDDNTSEAEVHNLNHDFIHANLLEISGKREESLEKYRLLQQELKNSSGTMKDSVDAAVARLSHG